MGARARAAAAKQGHSNTFPGSVANEDSSTNGKALTRYLSISSHATPCAKMSSVAKLSLHYQHSTPCPFNALVVTLLNPSLLRCARR